MTHTSTRGRHAAPARTPIAVLAKAASSPSNRRGALVVASSGLIITMAATTASATADNSTLAATPVAGEATVSDAAVAALALAPTVAAPADVEFASVDLEASSKPAPVIVPVARTADRVAPASTGAAAASAGTTQAASSVAPPAAVGGVVEYARQFVGTKYVLGGSSPEAGFDCSGFTQYVYAQFGISIPRSSSQQRYAGTVVSAADAQPGDLVWWPGHVGIYTGNGNHIAARNPGKPLQESVMYRSNPTYIRVG